MTTSRAIWIFITAVTGLRLAMIGAIELSGDEAYYWMWSQHLAPGYFSKGPAVAFAIRGGTALFGVTEFGVRFWSPLLAAGTSFILFCFARRLFNETVAFWTVIALNVTPISNVGSFVMTIDPLSIFFWSAAMLTFWLALEKSPRFSWHWPLTGLLVGLGFLSKYTNALELISIVIVLALVPRLRGEFKRVGFYSALGVFLLCTVPVIAWNTQHAWITLDHLRARGGLEGNAGFHPTAVLVFLAQHFLAYSPILFLALAWAVVAAWPRVQTQFKSLYLFWFGLPVFALYFLLSFKRPAAPNWDCLAFLSLAPLAIAYWNERIQTNRHLRRGAIVGIFLGLIMSVLALNTDILRSVNFHFPRRDPSNRLRAWSSATNALEKLRADLEAKNNQPMFLIADERDRAAEIAFYLRDRRVEGPGHPPVYIVESQDLQNQFSFWPRYDEFVEQPSRPAVSPNEVYTEENGVNLFVDRSALYIQEGHRERAPHNIRAGFQSVDRIATIESHRFDRSVRTWQIFLCRNYRTLPL